MNDNEDNRKTRLIQRSDTPWGRAEISGGDAGGTVQVPSPTAFPQAPAVPKPGQTVLMGVPTSTDPMQDPVTGWLVIVKGPGKGSSVKVGYQINTIGRDLSNRIALNFGDMGISSSKHAVLGYDPMTRKFLFQHSQGSNFTYLNGNPILAQVELKNGDIMRLGSTVLRFVAFCGEDFDWEASEEITGNEPKKA